MKRLALGSVVVFSVLVGLYTLWLLRAALVIFFLSLMLAAAVRPIFDRLAEANLPKRLGLATTFLIGTVLAGVLVVYAGSLLLGDVQRFVADVSREYDHLVMTWPQGSWLQRQLSRQLLAPQVIQPELERVAEIAQTVLGTALSVAAVAVQLVVIVALGIYWSVDRVHFERLWLSLLPVGPRAHARDTWRAIEDRVGAYLRYEMLGGIAAAVLLAAGHSALGFPYPMLLALAGGAVWLIPWLGALLALAATLFFSAPMLVMGGGSVALHVALAAAYTLLVFALLEYLVERRAREKSRYSPLLMALVLLGLADMLGVLGLVLAPPLAVALEVLGQQIIDRFVTAKPAPRASVDQQLESLRCEIAAAGIDSPELAGIVARLAELATQARKTLPEVRSANPGP